MKIVDKYILKELLKTQIVVLIILVAIFLSQSLIRLVTRAAVGSIPSELVGLLALYALPEILSIMLPLTLFISILITLGRLCSDSEMVVMRSVGYSTSRVMIITLVLALITGLLGFYCGVFLSPQASNARSDLLSSAENNPQYLPIESGRFVSVDERYTIYIDELVSDKEGQRQVQNIYVMEDPYDLKRSAVTIAKSGSLVTDRDGVQWLHLEHGSRYEGSLEIGSYRKASFDEFDAPISSREAQEREKTNISMKSTAELLASDNLAWQVEAQWRMSSLFAALVLTMVAVPLSMVNPRQGRFAKLMPAILIYASYYMFIFSVRNIVNNTDYLGLYPGLYLVPIVFLIFVAIPLNLPKYVIRKLLGDKRLRGGKA